MQQFIADHQHTLIEKGREINQLSSLAAVGVQGSGLSAGGVSQRGEAALCHIHGRAYHFPMLGGGRRDHPLLGEARSYLFAESSGPVSFSERYTSSVILASTQLRTLLRIVNPSIATLQIRFGGVLPLAFSDFMDSLRKTDTEVRLEGLSNSQTSASQLMLLFSLRRSFFRAPSISSEQITSCGHESIGSISVSTTSSQYEQTAYPLFDPLGTSGWFKSRDATFKDRDGHDLTLRKYIRYKFCQSQIMRLVPRLSQEWLLDMICRSDYNNQGFIEHIVRGTSKQAHLSKGLRMARASKILQSHNPKGEGRRCDIPSSVRGSPAYRREKVDMGMAQIYFFGPPTLFITMTANPQWIEIQSNLAPGQQWYHDPYLVNLVFLKKLQLMLDEIKQGRYFGGRRAVYIQYTIEFQKRGLPHAHILIRLEGAQPSTATDVDELVCATRAPRCQSQCKRCYQCMLHQSVEKHMIHACYPDRCFKNKTLKECAYGFPFQPCITSFVGDDGFWILRRKSGDQQVVMYNADLLASYDCHINTQVACSTRCVLYLRKYLSKGPDSISALLLPAGTDIGTQLNHFYESRCLSASEAAWMACELDFNVFEPTVQILKLYLPGEHPVYFDDLEEAESLMAKSIKPTHLDQYFLRPLGGGFDAIKFEEYFARHTVGMNNKPKLRKTPIIALVRNVNYSDPEHFALYMLLKHRSARSFADLIQGCATFEDSAIMSNLFQGADPSIHISVVSEMTARHVSYDQIVLYVVTVALHDTRRFENLFFETWESLLPESVRNGSPIDAIQAVEKQLHKEGTSLIDVLISPSESMRDLLLHAPHVNPDSFFMADCPINRLSPEQESVVGAIINGMVEKKLWYINGCAGSGKTHTLTALTRRLSHIGIRTICSAFTGVAASLLPGGLTCHRLFGLPVEEESEAKVSKIAPASLAAQIITHAQCFIIDEISMLSRESLDIIDLTIRTLTNTDAPFGGKMVILSGDFRQLAPIVKATRSSRSIIDASIASSQTFRQFTTLTLDKAHRFESDSWADFLLRIATGTGTPIPEIDGATSFTIPPEHGVHMISSTEDISSLLDIKFPLPTPLQVVASTHAQVAYYNNNRLMAHFADETSDYSAHYTFPPGIGLRAEDVRMCDINNSAPHKLTVAIGAPVMIIRNILVSQGIVNGALATVTGHSPNAITIRLHSTNKTHVLPRICFPIRISSKKEATRLQFPVVLAFSATVNKMQGKTTTQIMIDMTQPTFQHGQTYVALSRNRSPQNIYIIYDTHTTLTNIVHNEIIQFLKR